MNDPLPQETAGDEMHRATRAALSAIPYVGGAAVEYFNRLLAPPLQRRRDAWLNALAEQVAKMERQGRVKVEDLQNNEEFISTVMQALMVAVRNHRREKLEALTNAVLNVAVGHSPDDAKREMFLTLVDTFSVWHLQVLSLLSSPQAGTDVSQLALDLTCGRRQEVMKVVLAAHQELREQQEFAKKILEDLISAGLLLSGDPFGISKGTQSMPCLTRLGGEFMRLISKPEGQ
jgi:hypothetical protein